MQCLLKRALDNEGRVPTVVGMVRIPERSSAMSFEKCARQCRLHATHAHSGGDGQDIRTVSAVSFEKCTSFTKAFFRRSGNFADLGSRSGRS